MGVCSLGCWYFWNHMNLVHRACIQLLLLPPDRIIIKFTTLFLQLIITYVEGVSSDAVGSHSGTKMVVWLVSKIVAWSVIFHVIGVVVCPACSIELLLLFVATSAENGCWLVILAELSVLPVSICIVICVNVLRILYCGGTSESYVFRWVLHAVHHVLWVRSWLP